MEQKIISDASANITCTKDPEGNFTAYATKQVDFMVREQMVKLGFGNSCRLLQREMKKLSEDSVFSRDFRRLQ